MKKKQLLLDATFWKFVSVGIVNTIVGTTVIFVAYNLVHLNYCCSSALNYIIGSVVSYFLNKYFTFQNKDKSWSQVLKFVINITVCYIIAYGLAKPLVFNILSTQVQSIQDNASMLVGMILFVGLNYLGQRIIVFKKN